MFGYFMLGRTGLILLELLLLPPILLGQTSNGTQCSLARQRKALEVIYDMGDGDHWIKQDLWNTNGTCEPVLAPRNGNYTDVLQNAANLPSHCCWFGVECCVSETYDSNLSQCAQYQCNCTRGTVTGLSLGRNGLNGLLQDILSDEVLDDLACSLRLLFLGGNAPRPDFTGLRGYIPAGIEKLTDLRILSLSSNALHGTIPEQLTSLVNLAELDLSNNNLTGPVPSQLCGGGQRASQLRDLILSNNNLTGPLKLPACESLIYLDVQNNWLTGPMPDISSYRQLHILRLGNNNFSGSVQVDAFDLRLLVVLDLSMNYFTGPLPTFVGNSSQMTLLRLFNNSFSGSISPDFFTVGTMSNFLVYNNKLSGTLPENIGDARGISSLNMRNNDIHGTLPASLEQLAPNMGTVDLSFTRMSCCGYDFVEGQGYRYFNMSAPKLPSFLKPSSQLRPVVDTNAQLVNMRCPFIEVVAGNLGDGALYWALDPEYYLYSGCTCLAGYRGVWSSPVPGQPSMGPFLACVQEKDPWRTWYEQYPWAVVLIVLGGLLVAAWLTFQMCFRRGKNAAIVQGCFNIRKRIQGEPVGGQVSIVVTDIEGYSDLMKQSPELMTRALNAHNAIVRKSRWNNFGYTLEQEGDSYALVFYEAHDAVIFCLQTQLALNRQTWPEGLFGSESRDVNSKRRPQAPSLFNTISAMTNNLTHSLFGGRASTSGQQDDRGSTLLGVASGVRTSNTSMDCRPDSRQSSTAAGAAPPPASTAVPELSQGVLFPSGLDARVGSQRGAQPGLLFNGLRVRMGVATGALPPGSSSKGSAVMDLAKVVSDAANGGQIMIDEATFKAIKERIEEFGVVDHNGMNFKKLNAIQPPWYSCLKRKHLRNPDDALLLDMGEYTHCPGAQRLPLFQLEGTSTAADTPVEGAGAAAGPLPPATPRGSARRGGKGHEPMRLYQLVPPPLVGRAKAFGNKVTVKDEWYCSDAPYFDAPGTLEAPLGGAVEGPVVLPPITMAFVIAEGGKAFASRHRRDVRRVNDVAAACIRACLRVVRGGYLCRLQDGDLKYMVAFATPEAAVEWSLLLQDVLMYADWPEAALKFWREEYDDRGRLVFRGPRMKIGLCEGCPRSIIPDHIGRADYHGASVNQAARYMDAAAHGGMIAVEASLAVKVMETWRAAAAAAAAAAQAAEAAAAAGACASTVAGAAAAAAASCTSVGTSAGDSVKAGVLRSGTARNGAAGSAVQSAPVPPSCSASRKGRMSAVQEADGADGGEETAAAAAAAAGTAPAPLPAALPGPLAMSASSTAAGRQSVIRNGGSEPMVRHSGGPGPVAEAAESDGVDAGAAAAAAAAGTADSAAAVVAAAAAAFGNGNGGISAAAAAPTAAKAEAVYGTRAGAIRPPFESGPSMTSLASSTQLAASASATPVGDTSSSIAAAPPPLMPFGSSTSEPDSPAAAPPPPPPPPTAAAAAAGVGLSHRPTPVASVPSVDASCDGSVPYTGSTAAAAADQDALEQSQPAVHGQPHLTGGNSSLPPRPRSATAAAAPPPASMQLAFHNTTPTPTPTAGPRTHVSFAASASAADRPDLPPLASHPISVADSGAPSPAGPSLPQRTLYAAASTTTTIAAAAAAAAASSQPPLSPSAASSIRSPRLPALPPLSLPSERERDEELRAERAAAEASRRVCVDGPADASYAAHVLAFRIGVFRFKGSPEPLHMAHVILEHLAGRRFPADAPKGKGGKVSDSSGLLDQCDTHLPDLAAIMRDRFMLLYGPLAARPAPGPGGLALSHSLNLGAEDGSRSSPSNRRLRSLLSSNATRAGSPRGGGGAGAGASGGSSPRALAKSRSLAARNEPGILSGGGGGNSMSDSGVSGGAAAGSDGGGPRRGPGLMSQLMTQLTTKSMKWTTGRSAAAAAGRRDLSGCGAVAAGGGGIAGGGAGRQMELPPLAGGRGSGDGGGGGGGRNGAASPNPNPGVVAVDVTGVQGQGQGRAGGGGGGGTGRVEGDVGNGPAVAQGGSDPRVVRPSPLRFMSGRDDPPPDWDAGAAAAPAQPHLQQFADGAADAPRGDDHV